MNVHGLRDWTRLCVFCLGSDRLENQAITIS